jgi:predicted RNA binding protein YcfA (HicA-like mRNA interferase family)
MGRIPVLKPDEAIRILRNLGFDLIRQKGSHCQFKHVDGRQTTVPNHRAVICPRFCFVK